MKLLKPNWVHYDEKPIFSVDIHQDCLKFATGGQGADSGRVVIWNMLPIISEKAENDENVPKILCQMDNHLSCVNCVRWSQDGSMLASGSDDKLVMIWRLSQNASGTFGNGGISMNVESWKCAATLRGHSGDVLDLAWSAQDRWLASCSVDNSVIVWDAQSFPTIIAMLKGHTGLVKGIAWDPVGKYLASQSDDRSVKIWRTNDWSCSKTVTEPFDECGGTTHILRLSWSPDGQYIVSAHAMNSGGPTAQIIEREDWKCDKDFVGHRKAVTCVRFHNSILKGKSPKMKKSQQYCCLAMGSRDRSLSVWLTALQRPLVVIHDLFTGSVLDLSWGLEKYLLMACSSDGTLVCLQFTERELGMPMAEADKNSLYRRIYGKNANEENGSNCIIGTLIENQHYIRRSNDKMKLPPTLPSFKVTNHNNNFIDAISVSSLSSPSPSTSPSSSPLSVISSSNVNSNANGISTTKQNSDCNTSITIDSSGVGNGGTASPIRPIGKQLETRTADGKRRITPVFIPLNQDKSLPPSKPAYKLNEDDEILITTTTSAITTITTTATSTTTDNDNTDKDDDINVATNSITPTSNLLDESRLDNRLLKNSSQTKASTNLPEDITILNSKSFSTLLDQTKPKVNLSYYQASTSCPKLQINANTICEYQKTAIDYRVHVQNGNMKVGKMLLSKITTFISSSGKKLWDTFYGSPIVNFNFCSKYIILSNLDGTIRLLDMETCCAIFPVMSLNSPAIQCAFCPLCKLVGVITECGILRIWNIESQSVFLSATCSEIGSQNNKIIQFLIAESGMPIILLANGCSYTYSEKMGTWFVLNPKDPLTHYSLQAVVPKDFKRNYRIYPVTSVLATATDYTSMTNTFELNANEWQTKAKIAFIENQIKLCETIRSVNELEHWYTTLAYHLALNGTEIQLRQLLNSLSNDLFGETMNEYEDPKILTISKRQLLFSVLNVLKSNDRWQRIHAEYNEIYEQNSLNLKIDRKDQMEVISDINVAMEED